MSITFRPFPMVTVVPPPGVMAGTEAVVGDPRGRAPEIDAIRGWAALSVVCYHVFWETFGVAVPWLRNPYTSGLMAGRFDVILFFILSGDALSFPFFHEGGVRYLQRAALKRYPRLTVPIVVVTAVTALAMAAGLTPTVAASEIVDRTDWLGSFARFHPAAASAVRFAFFHVYEGGYRSDYLPFLWTMPIELIGSFALLLVLFVSSRLRGAAWFTAGLALLLLTADNYTGCFLVGLLLGRARALDVYARLPPMVGRLLAPCAIAVTLVLAGQQQVAGQQGLLRVASLGAVLLFSLYACGPAVRWLARDRVSQFLGRISYLLYLWHFVVLITLTSRLIVMTAGPDGAVTGPAALTIGALTVAISLGVSRGTLWIEGWARNVNAVLLRWLWKEGSGSHVWDDTAPRGASHP